MGRLQPNRWCREGACRLGAAPRGLHFARSMLFVMSVLTVLHAKMARAADTFPLSYSGRLTQSSGAPVEGPVDIELKFFATETEGTQLGDTYPFPGVTLQHGVFTLSLQLTPKEAQTILGSGSDPVYIEVHAAGRVYPRQRFSVVPFALRVPVDNSSLVYDTASGKLSINGAGTATPGQILTSDGSGKVRWDSLSYANLSAKTAAGGQPGEDQIITYKAGKWVAGNLADIPSSYGTVTAVTATSPLAVTNQTSIPIISLAQASGSMNGYLSSSDWTAFNAKQAAGSYLIELTGDVIASGPGSGSASLAAVALPGIATKVTFDAKGRILSGSSLTSADISDALGYTPLSAVSIATGTGLTGGPITTAGTIALASTGVTPGTYVRANVVVDAQGRLLGAASAPQIVDTDIAAAAGIAQSKIQGLQSDLSSKEPSLPSGGSVTQFLAGNKTWQSLSTAVVSEDAANLYYTDTRARAALSATAPLSYVSGTGVLSLSRADGVSNGYLSSSDWSEFNAKQNALGYIPANKAGDTLSGALNMSANDITNAGNIQIAAAKTLGLGVYTTDPASLTAGDKGKTWYNATDNQMKYWDGTAVQVVGAVGAALASLNGQTGATQSFAVPGSTGTAPSWSSTGNAHTLNIPLASAVGVTAGLLSNSDYSVFNAKQPAGSYLTNLSGDITSSGFSSGTVATTLQSVALPGTATKLTFDAKGRVTSGTSLSAGDLPAHSAALITSGTVGLAYGGTGTNLMTTGGAGQYLKQVTAGGAVTVGTLPSADITNALGYTPANKAGDTLSGALNMSANDITNAGNIQIAAAKTLGLGVYTSDPVGLSTGDKGKTWFNSTANQMKYWDGTAVQVVGAVGAALASLNGQTGATQSFAVPGSTGTAPSWTSAGNVHTINIPLASAAGVTAGLLSNSDYSVFNAKQPAGSYLTNLSGDITSSGFSSGTVATTLQSVALPGTATKLTYDAKGRVTAGTSLDAADLPPHSGALITSGTVSLAYGGTGTNLMTTGGAGQYLKQVTAGGAVTVGTLPSADITNALGYTPANKAGDTLSGALNLGGNDISNTGNVQIAAAKTLGLGVYTADPAGLTVGDKGKTWFNSTANQMKYWDGTAVQVVGAVGAALASLNGQTGATQSFAVPGSTGTAPSWSSAANVHTLNIPLASAAGVTAGLLSNSDYSVFNAKQPAGSYVTAVTGDITTSGFASGTVTATLPNVATAGTATKVSYDAKGRVTAGTSLSAADLPAHSATLITSGTLGVANGGTGAATLAANGVLLGNGASTLLSVAPGTSGNVLTSNGTTWTSATPAVTNWAAPGAIGATTPNSGSFTTINASGLVGIGTSTPAGKLELGSQSLSGADATYRGDLILTGNSGGLTTLSQNGGIEFKSATQGSGWGSRIIGWDTGAANTPLTFQTRAGSTNWSNAMSISSNGNVGIGTTNPLTKLNVNGKAAAISTTGAIWDHVALWADDIYGYLDSGNANTLRIRINPNTLDGPDTATYNDVMTLSGTGNVGIGTTSPTSNLDVQKSFGGGMPATSGTSEPNAIMRLRSDGGATVDWGMISNGSAWIQPRYYTNLSTNLNLLLNPNGGNVGIGTTSPITQLDVTGMIRSNLASAEGGRILLSNTSKTANNSAKDWVIYNMTGNYGDSLQFWNYDTPGCGSGMCKPRFTILDNGNIGIGTTAPANNLHLIATSSSTAGLKVESSTNDSTLSLKNTSAGGREWWLGSGGTGAGGGPNFYIYDYNSNGVRMSINSAGNVGIGTTAPTTKLDVRGGAIGSDGFNVILRIGHAVQTSDVSTASQSFTDLTGATLTFTLQRSMTIAMRGHGSVTGSGGNATYTHCGFRFAVDGTGQGDGTWGDEIIGVGRTGHPGWFASWSIGREVTLAAGTHTIKLQMTGWSGSDAACLNVANSYGGARLWLEGY